ncbi:unnamed protein product [Alternaria alternata]
MRLLYTASNGDIEWTDDIIRSEGIPPYAILSHTWGEQEVILEDLKSLESVKYSKLNKPDGWNKIQFCAQQAKRDGLAHFWVDTCCINKENYTELSEAINSMFRWYQNAERCYVFLSDVEGVLPEKNDESSSTWNAAFKASRWFKRGWTLQELLAPRSVEFFSRNSVRLGDKESLKRVIQEITKIPLEALSGDFSRFDVAERFSWAQGRQTTKEEDGAYCLLGIFGCHLPLIYGEGKEKALKRLQKEMVEASDRLDKIRSWLSAPDASTNHHKAQKQRQADTGLWLLESTQFKGWKDGAGSRLWLYGIPGCGKTVLSSTIIKHLLQHCQRDLRHVTAYFYFDFKDMQKQDPELMLCSLLHQLLQRLAMIPADFDAWFSSSGNGRRQPSLHELLVVVPQVMRGFTHVYIVLDALDECTRRPELLDILETMAGWQLDVLHVLMTSRKERDIETSLETYVRESDSTCLQRNIVDKDILRYVQQRLRDDRSLAKWNKDAGIVSEIETALMHGARGIRNLAMLRKSLATLPQTLDQTYDRILASIFEEDRAYAMRILQWLTFSARSLTVEQVAEVVALDVDREPVFDRDEVLTDPLEALDICSSLVTITTKPSTGVSKVPRRVVTLAHYSVQEYLVSDRIKQGPAKQYHMQEAESHEVITKGCFGYLNQFPTPISEAKFNTSALAEYSAKFWTFHFQKTEDDLGELCRLAMSVFTIDSPAHLTWIRLHNPEFPHKAPDFERNLESIRKPLYYAALLGLTTITKLLLSQGADPDVPGGENDSILHAASFMGHHAVVKLLIAGGANVNAFGGHFGYALQAASAVGHKRIVTRLLRAGAAVNLQGGYHGNALRAAIAGTHETTVRKLLDGGANVGPDEKLKGAIHYAVDSEQCTPSLIKMLQQFGASLDTVDAENMTPLHYCVKRSHTEIAEQLIGAGVPIDIRVRRQSWPREPFDPELGQVDNLLTVSGPVSIGLTPLHLAALIGEISIVQVLLEHGADPNALSVNGESPLHIALRGGLIGESYPDEWWILCRRVRESIDDSVSKYRRNAAISQAMQQRNEVLDALIADPRMSFTVTDCLRESLLHCIRYRSPGSATMVQVLIDKGADVSCENIYQQSPLHLASKAGDRASVAILLSAGLKAASIDTYGLNALHYAVQSRSLKTITGILMTEEARAVKLIASKDRYGQNALHYMFSPPPSKQLEKIILLLDLGADALEPDHSGISPLLKFIKDLKSALNLKIFRSFLEANRNASFVEYDGQTLGHLCASRSDFGVDVLEFLSGYNVDLAKKDCEGRTMLHHAATNGNLSSKSLEFLVYVVGVQIDEEDIHGRTALHYATKEAKCELRRNRSGFNRRQWIRDILLGYHVDLIGAPSVDKREVLLLEQGPGAGGTSSEDEGDSRF